MANQPKKIKPERPDDSLPPDQLQAKWDEYLDYHVGKPGNRPSKEVLVNPLLFDWLLEAIKYEAPEPLEDSPRKILYLEVLKETLEELPLINRDILKRYFGIEWDEPQTQDRIAEEMGLTQSNISLRIKFGKRDLAKLMREKLSERVKKELQG